MLKVTLLPLGKGTLTTERTVYFVRSLWQVVQAKPLAVCCSPTPVVTTEPALVIGDRAAALQELGQAVSAVALGAARGHGAFRIPIAERHGGAIEVTGVVAHGLR